MVAGMAMGFEAPFNQLNVCKNQYYKDYNKSWFSVRASLV
jgi:hypothetical protein